MFSQCFKFSSFSSIDARTRSLCSIISRNKWDLLTAVCIERRPVITPPLNDIEQKFKALLSEIDYEHSLKSDHEMKHEHEVKQQKLLKKGDADADVSIKETAQDLLDAWNDELSKFKFGSKITEDDKSNNTKSLNRKLDKHLVLLVQQQIGPQKHYLLPQGMLQDGETLRQAAERVVKETCGPELKATFYGNAPSGFYKYTYPKAIQESKKVVGAKVFIYLATHCKGQLLNKDQEFKWLDRVELSKELNGNYHKSISQFLIDEE